MNTLSSYPNIITLGAHPDDIEAMLSQAVQQAQSSGGEIGAIVATDGDATTEWHIPEILPTDPDEREAHIKTVRRAEGRAALSAMQIGQEHQHFLSLPDGKLSLPHNLVDLTSNTIAMAKRFHHAYGRVAIYTLGLEGFDGHPDHIATHLAGEMAATALHAEGIMVPIVGLNARGRGAHIVPVDPIGRLRKMDLLGYHASQMKHRADGTPDTEFFDRFMHDYGYAPLFERETYDVTWTQNDNGLVSASTSHNERE